MLSAALWLRKQQQQFCHVGSGQTVGSGHIGATSSSASTAFPGCLVVVQHDRKRHHSRGNSTITRPRRFATYPLATTSRHRPAVVANSANIVRRSETAPEHCGVRVPRNKQLLPSLPLAIILSVCYTPTSSFIVLCPALFFSRSMAATQDKRTDDGASPKHFHPYAH